MAIDIKPEKEKKFELPGSFNVLFYYSIVLLLVTLSAYLLISQWSSKLEAQVSKKQEVFKNLKKEENFKKNRNIVLKNKKLLDNYLLLSGEQKEVSNLFLVLEAATHPMVTIDSIMFSQEDGSITLAGKAINYKVVEQQYGVFKNFKLQKDVIGWVPKDSVDVTKEGDLTIKGNNLKIYNDPIAAEEIIEKSKNLLDRQSNPNLSQEERDKISSELSLLKSKEKEVVKAITSKEIADVELLGKYSPKEYSFDKGARKLIKNDWYEVKATERIDPISSAKLTSIMEFDAKDDFNIEFEFNLIPNPVMFQ